MDDQNKGYFFLVFILNLRSNVSKFRGFLVVQVKNFQFFSKHFSTFGF